MGQITTLAAGGVSVSRDGDGMRVRPDDQAALVPATTGGPILMLRTGMTCDGRGEAGEEMAKARFVAAGSGGGMRGEHGEADGRGRVWLARRLREAFARRDSLSFNFPRR